jgi:hypothetical protein
MLSGIVIELNSNQKLISLRNCCGFYTNYSPKKKKKNHNTDDNNKKNRINGVYIKLANTNAIVFIVDKQK